MTAAGAAVAVMLAADAAALLVLCVATVGLVRDLRHAPLGRLALDMLYPLSQFCFLTFNMVAILLTDDIAVGSRMAYSLMMAALAVVCAVVNKVLFRDLREAEAETLYDGQAVLLREQLDAQRRHFDGLKHDMAFAERENALMIGRIREIRSALEKGDVGRVRRLARDASALGAGTVVYCPNKVVDALCAVKIPALSAQGIRCTWCLGIPDDCPVPGVEVCAVIANMLDNAANACMALGPSDRWVDVRAGLVAGCLVIETSNGVAAVPSGAHAVGGGGGRRGRGFAEHGWGLTIIRDIVERHHGSVDIDRTVGADGRPAFVISVMLPLA